jgi:hypothetical protein
VGYISREAGILLWILGLIITSTVIYLVYSAAILDVTSFSGSLMTALLILAGIGILVFWASVLSQGVSGR